MVANPFAPLTAAEIERAVEIFHREQEGVSPPPPPPRAAQQEAVEK